MELNMIVITKYEPPEAPLWSVLACPRKRVLFVVVAVVNLESKSDTSYSVIERMSFPCQLWAWFVLFSTDERCEDTTIGTNYQVGIVDTSQRGLTGHACDCRYPSTLNGSQGLGGTTKWHVFARRHFNLLSRGMRLLLSLLRVATTFVALVAFIVFTVVG